MQWIDRLVGAIVPPQPQLINDSKTPSGRVHVGALRGVLIHDAVYREMRSRGIDARYTFGVDDYDPLDEIPAGLDDLYRPYLGQPLCNVPPPPDSTASDMAEHYITEFFDVFADLGVGATSYRMRDIYRNGAFNEAIDAILSKADVVRAIYKSVSNSQRPDDWYPFQVLCENCGRIGTTQVFAYRDGIVSYRCREDLVSWARGCGYTGAVSPFDGRGKLPWKLEWVAKWDSFGVTVEGAGKDHTTKGGSRDVAAACLAALFGKKAPLNIPYEFFLVGGAKMSSSRGVGASAREVADLLPPEVLRFLILKSPPNRPVNFSVDEQQIIKLFNEFDRFRSRALSERGTDDDRRLLRVCMVGQSDEWPDYEPPFQLLTTMLQLPHLDVEHEIAGRKGSPLTPVEQRHLTRRIQSVRVWLDRYAGPEEKFSVQEQTPEAVAGLSSVQKAFLRRVAQGATAVPWQDDALQSLLFDIARTTPIDSGLAFEALYVALLDRRAGPKAGSLLSYLSRGFVLARLSEVAYSVTLFWLESSESLESFEAWLTTRPENVRVERLHFELFTSVVDAESGSTVAGAGIVECRFSAAEKPGVRRARFSTVHSVVPDAAEEFGRFKVQAAQYARELGVMARISDVDVTFAWQHEDLRRTVIDLFGVGGLGRLTGVRQGQVAPQPD